METFRDAQSLHKLTTQVGMERSRFSVSNSKIGEELASEIKGKDNPQNQAKRHAQNEWIQAINRARSTCSLSCLSGGEVETDSTGSRTCSL